MKDLIIFISGVIGGILSTIFVATMVMLRFEDKCLDGESHVEDCRHGRKI